MADVTHILSQIEQGDPLATEQLLPLVYEELRNLAASQLSQEKPGQTLQATALVHEAYLRLVGNQQFENRRHFLGAAAEAMRRIMVDQARRRGRQKRGGQLLRVELFDQAERLAEDPDLILSLEELLPQLEAEDAAACRIAQLHLFAGLSVEEAEAMRPLPADDRNPLADNASADDIIVWLAYKEAKALIKFDAEASQEKPKPPAPPAEDLIK